MNISTETSPISTASHWQPSLDDDGIVIGFADVEQAIAIILSTPKGSVPHRPEFGCEGLGLLDGQFSKVAPLFIAYATDAILANEPRVQSVKIRAKQYDETRVFAGVVFNIQWTPIDSLVPQNMTYKV